MRIFVSIFICLFFLVIISVPNAVSGTCSYCPPASSPAPGGNPDDTFAVDSGFIREAPALNSDPSVVTLQSGYYTEFSSFVQAFKKSEVKSDAASTALQLINSTPLLVIPSGGLNGYEMETKL